MSFDDSLKLLVREAVIDTLREELPRLLKGMAAGGSEEWIGVADAVKLCNGNISAQLVRKWCVAKKVLANHEGRGWLINRADLQRFLSVRANPPPRIAPEPRAEVDRVLKGIR